MKLSNKTIPEDRQDPIYFSNELHDVGIEHITLVMCVNLSQLKHYQINSIYFKIYVTNTTVSEKILPQFLLSNL